CARPCWAATAGCRSSSGRRPTGPWWRRSARAARSPACPGPACTSGPSCCFPFTSARSRGPPCRGSKRMISHPTLVKPRLCLVGPMVGQNRGHVVTQGVVLARLFRQVGYEVLCASGLLNRYARFADIVRALVWHCGRVDVVLLQVYGGNSFVVEDVASWVSRRLGQKVVMILRGGTLPGFWARYPRWS